LMYDEALIFEQIPDRPSHHCASMVETPDGDLLCVWYAGSREKAADVALMIARWSGEEESWSSPQVLLDTPGKPDGNAVMHADPGGKLWVFHNVIQGQGWDTALLYLRTSEDGGATWTESALMDDEPGMMVRNSLLVLASGEWLLPAYDEKTWEGFCYISTDAGASWQRSGLMTSSVPVIQPALIQRADGSLLAYLRTGGDDRRIRASVSDNRGQNWSDCAPTQLQNPNSGIDMVRLQSGEIVLVFNNVASGRTPLHVALSTDECRSWPVIRTLETQPGEFSYPCVIQARTGLIHVVYTYDRKSIKYVCCDVDWLDSVIRI